MTSRANAKPEVSLVNEESNTVVSTVAFSELDKTEIQWLENLLKLGKIKYSLKVRYE